MHLVPTTIPTVLTPETRKRVIAGAVQEVKSTLSRKLGNDDPHGLTASVLGNCLGQSDQVALDFSTQLERVANAYVTSVISGLFGDLQFIHQNLAASSWGDAFSEMNAFTIDNDYGYKVFTVLNGARGFFVCLSDSANDCGDAMHEIHLRSIEPDEMKSTSSIESLLASGIEISLRIGSRGPVDRGYLISLIPTEAQPPKWQADGALNDWHALSAAVADLVDLAEQMRASAC